MGVVIGPLCLLVAPKLTEWAETSPTRADNRIFNYYNYHLKNWDLPQIIKMRFGSSLPIFSEKAMAHHSSTPAWKVPWTEEPGGLQSMGLLSVRHY